MSILPILIFLAALLYSSVGHAGASGYLAAMALVGMAPALMKPSALLLNVLVASIATARFARAGCFSWSLLWPFCVGSIPAAFLGGAMRVPGLWYKVGVGLVLLFAAYRLWVAPALAAGKTRMVPVAAAVLCGAAIGVLSGLTGTGGGIFLSPLLLFAGWADTRESAGVSAAFILLNSIAGLAGLWTAAVPLPPQISLWALAAVIGGAVGSDLGSRRLGNSTLRRLLALVLVIAGVKLMFV